MLVARGDAALLAGGGGSPVSQDCLSSTLSHCELRACRALLVSRPSERPASGGKEARVGSSPGEAEWVRRAVGAAAGSPDDWSPLATQPGLRACGSFLPSFRKSISNTSALPPPPQPRLPLWPFLPAGQPSLPSPSPLRPPSAPKVASPVCPCPETAQLSPPWGELNAGNKACCELC